MKNSFKKKFLVLFLIITMVLTFSFAPAERAYAGGALFGLADLFTGGLLSMVTLKISPLFPAIALCTVGIGPSFCSGGDSGVPIITPPAGASGCSYAIPLTFYIPSFNVETYVKNIDELCYNDYAAPSDCYGGEFGPSVCLSGNPGGGEHCLPSSISQPRYRAPTFSDPGFGFENGYPSEAWSHPDWVTNCAIPDPAGMYARTPSQLWTTGWTTGTGPGCNPFYHKSIPGTPGTIDETHNKIAIYRFSLPNTLSQESLAVTLIAAPGGNYGYGGGFADQFGNGWTGGKGSWGEGSYFSYSPKSDSPIAVLDYSKICTGNVCKVEDANNVPQNSYIVYVAKILGDYTFPIITGYECVAYPGLEACIYQPILGPSTRPNKFLTTNSSAASVTFPAHGESSPSDSWSFGDAYLGPFQTGVPDQSLCTPPVNGACGTTHNNCSAGILGATAEYSDQWQWWCKSPNFASANGMTPPYDILCAEMKNTCTLPLIWNGTSCVSLSGTLLPATSTCTITSGNSTCTKVLTWTTTNPIGISAVTASGITSINGNSGSQAFTVPYSGRTFYLYNNALSLATATVTTDCASGTAWNGTICSPVPTTCTLPWGGTITSGNSVTAYQSSSVTYPATCTSETRNCSNATLSGSYANQSCTVGVNGACATTHYNCTTGTSTNNLNSPSRWTWTCAGLNEGDPSAQCFQKKTPGVIEN